MARRYARDNRGRFASSGSGATARGGRLRTAAGNKRKTQTMQASAAPKGTIGKPRGLKPQSAKKLRTGIAVNRMRSINEKIGNGPDTAAVNISMSGSRGRRLNAEISRNVTAQKAATRLADKARNRQAKSDASRAKKLRDAQAGNIAKAKGISKGQVTSALKAQPPSVQIKALKNFVRENRANVRPARAAVKPAAKRKSVGTISEAKAGRIISRIDANRPGLRKATGSARKTQNSIRTQRKATDFALAAGARARKQGKSLSVNESLQRAVKNASAKLARGRRR